MNISLARKLKPFNLPAFSLIHFQKELVGFIFMFSLGIVLGFVVAYFGGTKVSLLSDIEVLTYFDGQTYKDTDKSLLYFALLLVFSTSYLGLFLIPCLFFLRGYLFSCTLTALYIKLGAKGLFVSLFSSAIPLFMLLPCLLIIGSDSFRLSRSLAEYKFGGVGQTPAIFPYRHLLVVLPLIIIERLYVIYMLPLIFSKFL